MKVPTSETPRGGTTALVALLVVSVVLTTVYFREGETGPLRRLRRAVLAASAPVALAGDWVTSPVRAVGEWFHGVGVSRTEVDELRRQNAELRARVAELEEARLENERLRALVEFAEASELEARGARIIGRPSTTWEGVITIDQGTDDGIAVGMPVLAQQGLLGQVVQTSARSARVRLITDQRSGVAALVQRSRAPGIVKGSIGGALTLDFVDPKTVPRRGDVVLTSGLGGVYPKGLLVGEVVNVEMRANDLHPRVELASAVPFDDLEEVLVLVGPPPSTDAGAGE